MPRGAGEVLTPPAGAGRSRSINPTPAVPANGDDGQESLLQQSRPCAVAGRRPSPIVSSAKIRSRAVCIPLRAVSLLETMPRPGARSGRWAHSPTAERSRGSLCSARVHRIDGRLALERALAGHHLVEHAAEREDVAAVIDPSPADLLGRHVARRCRDGSGFGRARRGRVWSVGCRTHRGVRCEAEVEDLHPAVRRR